MSAIPEVVAIGFPGNREAGATAYQYKRLPGPEHSIYGPVSSGRLAESKFASAELLEIRLPRADILRIPRSVATWGLQVERFRPIDD